MPSTTPPCAQHPDKDLWFPEQKQGALEPAAICYTCPVKTACARAAASLQPTDGVWAGIDVGRNTDAMIILRQMAGMDTGGIIPGVAHGYTASYRKGCRCHACKAANSRSVSISRNKAANRKRETLPDTVKHGTSGGYKYWQCRCPECREWNRADKNEYHHRKKAS